jgi:hypothetical protein
MGKSLLGALVNINGLTFAFQSQYNYGKVTCCVTMKPHDHKLCKINTKTHCLLTYADFNNQPVKFFTCHETRAQVTG